MSYPAPRPAYIGPPAHHGGPGNKPIDRIVIHETQSPCRPGVARATARYFQHTDRPASAHYITDPTEVIQSTLDDIVAYHAPPNRHTIGVELCGYSDPDDKTRFRKGSPNREAAERAQVLVAQLCLAYDVPPYFRTARQLTRGRRGVTTHAEVSEAYHQTTHWDPGAWPRWWFMRGVRRHVRRLRREGVK